MRLTLKIIAMMCLAVILLLAADSLFLVQREVRLYDTDMQQDALHLGRTLRELVIRTMSSEGEEGVLALLQELNEGDSSIRVSWVSLDGPTDGPPVPSIPSAELESVRQGHEASFKRARLPGGGYRFTYVPLEPGQPGRGALEMRESLAGLTAFNRTTIIRSFALGGLIALLGSFMVWVIGVRMVGRPLDMLVEKTRRIGAGYFTGDQTFPGRDELSRLAVAMNEMCAQLAAARDALRAESEAKLNALDQLRHAERLAMLGRLSSGIAHEMGTPLNVVAGRAKMIADETLDREEVISSARIIREQADRMAKIIRQLLDFARHRRSQRRPEKIQQLTAHTLEALEPDAREKGVTFELVQDNELPAVPVDRSQLEQVVMNLVVNAIQAMPGGGKIRLSLAREGRRSPAQPNDPQKDVVVLRVADEGQGIPEDSRELIFEPFFTTKRTGRGTGLGLAIVKRIVEEHGGWIDVQSELGKGTCFSVFLPLEVEA
jgi:two-component system NtrC family sensor kinase